MAYSFQLNNTGWTSNANVFFVFKTFFKTVWTVPQSSDGFSTFSYTSDVITSDTVAPAAGSIANNLAWWVHRQPAIGAGIYAPGGREFCFQKSSTSGCRVKVSRAGFGQLSIQAIAGGLIADTETFTINDGSTAVIFEFDKNGMVTPGRTPVVITNDYTAAQVATAIVTAINGAGLNLTAAVWISGVSTFIVCKRTAGQTGTMAISDTVANATFEVLAVSLTVAPMAVDEYVLLGTGTNASPGLGVGLFGNGVLTFRMEMVLETSAPYGVQIASFDSGGADSTRGFGVFCIPLEGPPATSDPDPYVYGIVNASGISQSNYNNRWTLLSGGSQAFCAYYGYDQPWANANAVCACAAQNAVRQILPAGASGAGIGNNPSNNNVDFMPMIWSGRASNDIGMMKGIGKDVYYLGTASSVGTTYNGLQWYAPGQSIALKWDGSTAILV